MRPPALLAILALVACIFGLGQLGRILYFSREGRGFQSSDAPVSMVLINTTSGVRGQGQGAQDRQDGLPAEGPRSPGGSQDGLGIEIGLAPTNESVRVTVQQLACSRAVLVQVFVTVLNFDCAVVRMPPPKPSDKPRAAAIHLRAADQSCHYRWYLRGQHLLGGTLLEPHDSSGSTHATYWAQAVVDEPVAVGKYVVEVTRRVPFGVRRLGEFLNDIDVVSDANRDIGVAQASAALASKQPAKRRPAQRRPAACGANLDGIAAAPGPPALRSWLQLPVCAFAANSSAWSNGAWELESALRLRDIADANTTILIPDNAKAADEGVEPYVWVPRHCRLVRLSVADLLEARGTKKMNVIFFGTSRLRNIASVFSSWAGGNFTKEVDDHASWNHGGGAALRTFVSFNMMSSNNHQPLNFKVALSRLERALADASGALDLEGNDTDTAIVVSVGIWEALYFPKATEADFRTYVSGILETLASRAPRASLIFVTDPSFHLWKEAVPAQLPTGTAFKFDFWAKSGWERPMQTSLKLLTLFAATAKKVIVESHPRWRLVDFHALSQSNRLACHDGIHYEPGVDDLLAAALANALLP